MVKTVSGIIGMAVSLVAIRLLGQANAPAWMEGGAYAAFVVFLITTVIALAKFIKHLFGVITDMQNTHKAEIQAERARSDEESEKLRKEIRESTEKRFQDLHSQLAVQANTEIERAFQRRGQ